MKNSLKKEFQYYIDHQSELVEQYNGKIIVIKDCKVIGTYDDDLKAIEASSKLHKLGTFLVQKCEEGEDNYTQTFHSRVSFG